VATEKGGTFCGGGGGGAGCGVDYAFSVLRADWFLWDRFGWCWN